MASTGWASPVTWSPEQDAAQPSPAQRRAALIEATREAMAAAPDDPWKPGGACREPLKHALEQLRPLREWWFDPELPLDQVSAPGWAVFLAGKSAALAREWAREIKSGTRPLLLCEAAPDGHYKVIYDLPVVEAARALGLQSWPACVQAARADITYPDGLPLRERFAWLREYLGLHSAVLINAQASTGWRA